MTTFRLEKSALSTRTLSKFNVLKDDGAIVGVVTVAASEENDFLAHWKLPPAKNASTAKAGRSKFVAALRSRATKPSKQAILRGC